MPGNMQRLEDHPDLGPVHPGFTFLSLSGFALAFVGSIVEYLNANGLIEHYSELDSIVARSAIGGGLALFIGSFIAGQVFRPQKRS
jgi:hypothetical protein